jgi:hypothetical protein
VFFPGATYHGGSARTPNRAFAIGAILLAASEIGAVALQYSAAWTRIAIAITRAWGYAG